MLQNQASIFVILFVLFTSAKINYLCYNNQAGVFLANHLIMIHSNNQSLGVWGENAAASLLVFFYWLQQCV